MFSLLFMLLLFFFLLLSFIFLAETPTEPILPATEANPQGK